MRLPRSWCFSWSLFGPIWGKIASLAQRTPHNHARKLPPAIAAPLHNRTVDN